MGLFQADLDAAPVDLATWVGPENAFAGLRARDKQQAIVRLAVGLARQRGLDDRVVIDALMTREHLGSTGLGWGVALPHARIPGLERICGAVASLESPIEFAALDEQPVDLVCMLLAPGGGHAGHLHALAAISRRLR